MYKKVLVPLDGSELAECTLEHVKNLFKHGDAEVVILLNVVTLDIPWARHGNRDIDFDTLKKNMFSLSRRYLNEVKSRLSAEGIMVGTESLESNRPAQMILEFAREHEIDIIVIATHGYSGLKKFVLGSVAQTVLQQSHTNVLLIRPDACKAGSTRD